MTLQQRLAKIQKLEKKLSDLKKVKFFAGQTVFLSESKTRKGEFLLSEFEQPNSKTIVINKEFSKQLNSISGAKIVKLKAV